MKFINNILTIIILCLSFSCSQKNVYNENKPVIITGKILHYNGENAELHFIYSQPVIPFSKELIEIDSAGNFEYVIAGYVPLDARLLMANTFANIYFIYHPGDSIHIEFEAEDNRMAVLRSVRFSADGAETNKQLNDFQILREENNLGYSAINQEESSKKNVEDFMAQMDSLKEKQLNLYDQFTTEFSVNEEVKNWSRLFALETYYFFLDDYSYGKDDLPQNYFNYNNEVIPLSVDKLVSWQVLWSRINSYWNNNTTPAIIKQYPEILEAANNELLNADSLAIDYINKNTPDKLLAQLLVAHYYTLQFEADLIDGYQRNRQMLDVCIDEPFIKEPLDKNFQIISDLINKPDELTNEVLAIIDDVPVENTVERIFSDNKGKVTYLDCWATYCGPCIKAMPDSKILLEKFKGESVSFVYVCVESDEKLWRSRLSEFNLGGGHHYFLDQEQSKFFRSTMNAQGLPQYYLIDKDGKIVEQGAQLHPGNKETEDKITQLLK